MCYCDITKTHVDMGCIYLIINQNNTIVSIIKVKETRVPCVDELLYRSFLSSIF